MNTRYNYVYNDKTIQTNVHSSGSQAVRRGRHAFCKKAQRRLVRSAKQGK